LSLLPSGGCALKTTSTAPIFGLAGLNRVEKHEEATKSEPWSPPNPQQWNQYDALTESSAPSFHIQYTPEIDEPTNQFGVPAPPPELTCNTNAQVAKLIGKY
jgi:predicted AlkP superfamily pyrophosphatase or phosphodiesterase